MFKSIIKFFKEAAETSQLARFGDPELDLLFIDSKIKFEQDKIDREERKIKALESIAKTLRRNS